MSLAQLLITLWSSVWIGLIIQHEVKVRLDCVTPVCVGFGYLLAVHASYLSIPLNRVSRIGLFLVNGAEIPACRSR